MKARYSLLFFFHSFQFTYMGFQKFNIKSVVFFAVCLRMNTRPTKVVCLAPAEEHIIVRWSPCPVCHNQKKSSVQWANEWLLPRIEPCTKGPNCMLDTHFTRKALNSRERANATLAKEHLWKWLYPSSNGEPGEQLLEENKPEIFVKDF